jgi:hypothetical protein
MSVLQMAKNLVRLRGSLHIKLSVVQNASRGVRKLGGDLRGASLGKARIYPRRWLTE